MSPSGIARRRSGKVHATSYIGSSRPFATVATLRNVQRRSGVLDADVGRALDVLKGRGISAMAVTVIGETWCDKATSSTSRARPLVSRFTRYDPRQMISFSENRSRFGPVDVAIHLLGVVGLAASLTLVFLGMRAVMDIGGFCAEGGPYEIQTHCPEGVPLLMIGGIFGLFLFGGLMAWKGSVIGGPYAALVGLAWPALFLSLGWNFLEYALSLHRVRASSGVGSYRECSS